MLNEKILEQYHNLGQKMSAKSARPDVLWNRNCYISILYSYNAVISDCSLNVHETKETSIQFLGFVSELLSQLPLPS